MDGSGYSRLVHRNLPIEHEPRSGELQASKAPVGKPGFRVYWASKAPVGEPGFRESA
jgi:hypothetical protein